MLERRRLDIRGTGSRPGGHLDLGHRAGQRGSRRQIQMDGTGHTVQSARGIRSHRDRHGPIGEARPVTVPGNRRIDPPAHPRCEETRLDRRLVRTDPAELGRTIRGEQQQRHPGVERLHRRRKQVRGGRSRGAQHRGRRAGLTSDAERRESGDPLVDPHVHTQCTMTREVHCRERESLGSGPRRKDEVAHPMRDQLREERGRSCHRR